MSFDNQKKQFLSKLDKSKKGSIDKAIKSLVDLINSSNDYYTTSSCSGRIMLLTRPKNGKKNLAEWLFTSHEKISQRTLSKLLEEAGSNEEVWFKKEGMILHVCCRTIEKALALVNAAREAGIKRAGIISSGKKGSIVEIFDSERIELPVIIKGKILVDDALVKVLVSSANIKVGNTHRYIKRFYSIIKKNKIL